MRRRKPDSGLSKYEVRKMVNFALTHLPQLDEATLQNFLGRIDANHTSGRISPRMLTQHLQHTRRYYSDACSYTLQILADLLDVQMKNPRAITALLRMGVFAAEVPNTRTAMVAQP